MGEGGESSRDLSKTSISKIIEPQHLQYNRIKGGKII